MRNMIFTPRVVTSNDPYMVKIIYFTSLSKLLRWGVLYVLFSAVEAGFVLLCLRALDLEDDDDGND